MKTVLMVAEKPSLAQSLAQILSNGSSRSRKGLNGACSVHEYDGVFKSQPARFKMTSVCGHVMTTDFIGKYNNWDRVDPAELFIAPIEKKEANPKLQMPKFLQVEARGCDYLVLWLDCDKEGENICFEVVDIVTHVMKISSARSEQVIYRAKFSAITDKDIKSAMQNLIEPNKNEAMSVDARQELDLRIGCAFTRFQTKFFQNKYGNLDSSLISFGPCQTPTLGFCVERHDKIASFKPETYWVLSVKVCAPSEKVLSLEWDRCRTFDNEVANLFLCMIKNKKEALVTNVSQKEKSRPRPLALNTVELMRVASSGLNMGPHHAMQIAERLYTQGYISYPRTETTHYPANFNLKGTLMLQSKSSDWGAEVRDLLSGTLVRPREGHDSGDHPPITPMKAASRNELDDDSWRLYDYITRHFIGTLSPDLKYLHTVISFEIGEESFTCSGKTLLDPGFTKVMSWQGIGDDETLPNLKRGDICKVVEVKLNEKLTCPPDYLTEAELITLMEKHGIGTDASIPVHINNICQRNYVTVSSGRRLKPTTLGIVLVHGYQKIDVDLVLPTMRAAVEKQLNLIALGKEDFHSVLHHTITVFRLKFQYFVLHISLMDELFEASFSPLSESGKPQSRCGKCRRYMKLIATKPSRLHCSNCDETLNVPQNGSIRIFRELKCPLDDFELLQWTGGAKGKSYIFCPYCYNNPPFRDMKKLAGCNSCTHPTCSYSLVSTGVANCSVCDGGVLVLDPGSGPKWKLSCNKCDVIVYLFEDASKVIVCESEDDTCKDCGSQLILVEYKREKTKLGGTCTEATGCIFCDSRFSALVDQQQAMKSRMQFRNPGRGRGRGRGRGGRSKGRGKSKPKDKMAQLAAYFV